MNRFRATCFALLLCISAGARAQAVNGAELLRWADATERVNLGTSRGSDLGDSGYFLGYVKGVLDTEGKMLCIPSNVSYAQITRIVQDYLRANTQEWGKSGSLAILVSLIRAFPCQ